LIFGLYVARIMCTALQTRQAVLSVVKMFAILLFGCMTQYVCSDYVWTRISFVALYHQLSFRVFTNSVLCDQVAAFVVQEKDAICFLA